MGARSAKKNIIPPQKVLIIQTAFLGDAVLATALLEKIHAHYPNTKIDFLVRSDNAGLFEQHPFVHQLLVWHKKEKKYMHWWQLLKKIRQAKYNWVINVQRYAATGLWTALSGAQERRGFLRNPLSFCFTKRVEYRHKLHEVERNQRLINDLTDDYFVKPKLYPPNFEQVVTKLGAALLPKNYVCIAPCSVWFTKQLPQEKWLECIDTLNHKKPLVLLGAKSDRTTCENLKEKIAERYPHYEVYNAAGQLSLLESAAIIQNASLNYTNDSGPLHIASATNAPVRAIFCSTTTDYGFGPLSDDRKIIQTQLPLSCRPCGRHGWKACPLSHFKCAQSIVFSEENYEQTSLTSDL